MRKSVVVTLMVGALVFGLVVGGVSLAAAETEPAAGETAVEGQDVAVERQGPVEHLAELLGLEVDTLIGERRSGKSLAKIAEEAGIETDELVDTIHEERIAEVRERVDAGLMTDEQLEYAEEHLRERIEERIMMEGVTGLAQGGPPVPRGMRPPFAGADGTPPQPPVGEVPVPEEG